MQYIFIVRHGHADFIGASDFERQLTPRGVAATQKTAAFIQQKCRDLDFSVDLCISSAATRTRQTTEIISETNTIKNCQYYQELYSTSMSTWLDKITPHDKKNIILIGHNPTLSQMLNNFCRQEIYMQPANCALIKLEILPDGIRYPATLIETFC